MEVVVQIFEEEVTEKSASPAYAAIRSLTEVIRQSSESTGQGLIKELECAKERLIQEAIKYKQATGRTPLSIMSGCDMFMHHIHKTLSEGDRAEFDNLKASLVNLGIKLSGMRPNCLARIAQVAIRCFKDEQVILVHGYSDVVINVLVKAAEKFNFSVIVTECRPFCEGYIASKKLLDAGITHRIIVDNAAANVMDSVDMVMVGAEAVVENGGVINRVGTYGLCLIAKAFLKPVYVCTDSLKFVRMFPLSQRDLPEFTQSLIQPWSCHNPSDTFCHNSSLESISGAICDLTPPDLITLLFTDLGILTPSGISDELIQLFR